MGLPDAVAVGRASPPVPWWLRVFLLVNVVQDAALGISALVSPAHHLIPLRGLSPLNARFVGCLYLGGGMVILLAALAGRAVDTRIALGSFLAITVLVLALTIAYWNLFTVDGVPWLWLGTYLADPPIAAVALVRLRLLRAAEPGRHRRTALFAVQAVLFGGAGTALLLAPDPVLGAWPWSVTRPLTRVYAAFLLAFALGAVLAAGERRLAAIRPFVAGSLVLFALSLSVSLIHLARFHTGAGRWLWFTVHAAGLTLLTAALLASSNRPGGDRPGDLPRSAKAGP